jgi:hypothetical protein
MHEVHLQLDTIILICQTCDYIFPIPKHCGKQMTIKNDRLECWKGEHAPCCNSASFRDLPEHHGQKMIIKK